ncbi:hypothetical protein GQ53DRAFT_742129 [Thozetella sp. PMI_491]|nr:hypothetical protein GQ53DRAFT_742129 [Thozetella sp. PMI_491]
MFVGICINSDSEALAPPPLDPQARLSTGIPRWHGLDIASLGPIDLDATQSLAACEMVAAAEPRPQLAQL